MADIGVVQNVHGGGINTHQATHCGHLTKKTVFTLKLAATPEPDDTIRGREVAVEQAARLLSDRSRSPIAGTSGSRHQHQSRSQQYTSTAEPSRIYRYKSESQ